jgi:hypothetical protein
MSRMMGVLLEPDVPTTTDGSTIWRYMSVWSFSKLVKESSLYLPNAYAYEETDINEGRFGRSYVDVLRRAYALDQDPDEPATAARQQAEEELANHCTLLKAYRRHSYISCWTLREKVSDTMWDSFCPDGEGVAIKSTVGAVYENLERGSAAYFGASGSLLTDHPIVYDREKAHLRLDRLSMLNMLLPLFALDGGADTYKHEREYRFVVTDYDGVGDGIQEYAGTPSGPTLVDRDGAVVRTGKHPKCDGVQIPIDLTRMAFEVRVHPCGGRPLQTQVNRLLERHGLTLEVATSS